MGRAASRGGPQGDRSAAHPARAAGAARRSASVPRHDPREARRPVPAVAPGFVRALERSLRELRARSSFRVVAYSLLSDHAHFIVEASDPRALSAGMKALGARVARTVHRVFRSAGAVLADRYHAHALRTPREVRNALRTCCSMPRNTGFDSRTPCSTRARRGAGSRGSGRRLSTRATPHQCRVPAAGSYRLDGGGRG
ncbi:MAG: hypothetical protein DCC71_06505 [Proteobacteria bacterium]|nr:MAG: hypothetical protein DCC71_06505 [Pseudomonadota bacterium]